MTRFAIVLVVALAWSSAALSQTLDPLTMRLLTDASNATTSADIQQILKQDGLTANQQIFWDNALEISSSDFAGEAAGRAALVRLMEAAALQSGATADTIALDTLTPEDIAASQADAAGFPDKADLLLYLLLRSPSVRTEFGRDDTYDAMRFVPSPDQPHLVQEQTSTPYLDLTPTLTAKLVPPDQDPVAVPSGEQGKSRRLNLQALSDLIVMAKALRTASRLPANFRIYAQLIALDAARRVNLEDPSDFRKTEFGLESAAASALNAYNGTDPLLRQEAETASRRLPTAAFFDRVFDAAANLYHAAPADTPAARMWAAWGEALSRFAYGDAPGPALAAVAQQLTAGTAPHATIFGLLLANLPADEAAALGDTTGWRQAVVTALAGHDPAAASTPVDYHNELDFLRLMDTIGRPDIAGRMLISRLPVARGTNVEGDYLRELAATSRDYCDLISFAMSDEAGWQPRSRDGYPWQLDFLNTFNAKGTLAGRGEIVAYDGTHTPYSATDPDEDCATVNQIYGIVDSPPPGSLVGRTPDADRPQMVAGIEGWVKDAMARPTPAPSLAPYLKLVWEDWFLQAFEALKDPGLAPASFHYHAIGATSLASVAAVQGLLQSPIATPQQKELIQLFLDTRQFLQTNYP